MSSVGQHRINDEASDPTIGRLVADASRDVSALVQAEIALAKSELRVSVKALGIGGALLAVTAFLGVLIIILASITAAYFITWALDPAWAFLIVTGFWMLVAAILALVGIKKLKQVRAPEKTIATAKTLPNALKGNPRTSSVPAVGAGSGDTAAVPGGAGTQARHKS